MVLDDNEDIRRLIAECFQLFGADECYTYASVAEMQADAPHALSCNLALLDVNLGDRVPTGIDAKAWLLAEHFAGRIAFITGHARMHPELLYAQKTTGVPVYEKPVPLRDLEKLWIETP